MLASLIICCCQGFKAFTWHETKLSIPVLFTNKRIFLPNSIEYKKSDINKIQFQTKKEFGFVTLNKFLILGN